jgi:hypothetical protein
MGFEFFFGPYAHPAEKVEGLLTDGLCCVWNIVICDEKVNKNDW